MRMLLFLAALIALSSATCETVLTANSLFRTATQFSDGSYSSSVSNWQTFSALRACDITIGTYSATGVSFGCNGRQVSTIDMGTLSDIDTKYGLGNVIGDLASFFSMRAITQNGNNQTLVVSDFNGVIKPLNVVFPDPSRNPAIVPQEGHLYLVRYAPSDNATMTISIVRLLFQSVTADGNANIKSAHISWDIIYYNHGIDDYYLTPTPLCMVNSTVNAPIVTPVAATQNGSPCTCTNSNGGGDFTGATIGLSIALVVVAGVAIAALVLTLAKGGYRQL